jgi:outer membrane protein assembly factor BamE
MRRIIASAAGPSGRRPQPVRAPVLLAGLVLPALFAGCASPTSDALFGLVTPYRMEIVQGNVVTREQAAAVRPGMTRQQVRAVLGSPLLTSPFHGDRWDYVFTIRRQGTEPQQRSVVALFEGDRLKELQAPELPGEREFVASITRASARSDAPAPVLELTPEQRAALPRPPARPAPAPEPEGATRTFPPLDPG